MIDSRELRLGNWVQVNGFPMYVVGIYNDNIIYCDFEGNEGGVWEFDDKNPCEPILLTEEVLLKCGCKNIPHKVFTSNYELPLKRNKSLYITDVGTPNFMVGIIERDFETNQIEDCVNIHNFDFEKEMYLHQLQNHYFALTGKELEIKL